MRLICLAPILLGISLAHAQNAADLPEDCAVIADDQSRLACFDSFYPSAAAADEDPIEPDLPPIEARARLEAASERNWFSITPHKPNYILPASYNFSSDFSPYPALGEFFSDTEIKFQLSLKTLIWPDLWKQSSLWVAYTQLSFWQLYADEEASAPFRETNHEPELRWQVPVNFRLFGMNARLASLALNHQSNGQSDPNSRSWNRITGQVVFEKGNFVFAAKSWIRVDNPEDDDNPNIEDFMGRIELGGAYEWDNHTLAIGLKNSLDSNMRSGVSVDWTFPMTQHLKGYVQLYSGYGESLIDMENYSNRIGVGIALTDWL